MNDTCYPIDYPVATTTGRPCGAGWVVRMHVHITPAQKLLLRFLSHQMFFCVLSFVSKTFETTGVHDSINSSTAVLILPL